MSTLVLAPDYQPINYLPLSTIGWQTAVKLYFLNKVQVIEWHEDWIIHSEKLNMQVPSVVVVNKGFRRPKQGKMRFSRHNMLLRDLFTCQYCNEQFANKELTIDHVIPNSKGGKTSWENCVTACKTCNSKKGSKLWKPQKNPVCPDYWKLVASVKKTTTAVNHPEWEKYLVGTVDTFV